MCGNCVRKLDQPKYWGWIIVLANFVCLFLIVGTVRSMGIFYDEWLEYFHDASSVTSSVGTMIGAMTCLAGPIANTLATRFGTRPVVISGGVISSVGFFSTAFVPDIYVLFVTYGFMTGFGFALAYIPMLTVTLDYFKERPSLVIGLASTGVGIGGMVLPIILEYLTEAYSWRGTAIVMSAAMLNICVCGAVVRPLQEAEEHRPNAPIKAHGNAASGVVCSDNTNMSGGVINMTVPETPPQGYHDNTERVILSPDCKSLEAAKGSHAEIISKYNPRSSSCGKADDVQVGDQPDSEAPHTAIGKNKNKTLKRSFKHLFTNVSFILINIDIIFFSAALFTIFAHLKSAVIAVGGVSVHEGTYALTVLNAGSLVGALVTGFMLYRFPKIDALFVIIVETTVCGASMILIPFVSSAYSYVLAVCFVAGFTLNPYDYLLQLVYKDMVGIADVTLAFGITYASYGIGGLAGSALAGFVYDMTGDYANSLYIAGAFYFVSNILIIRPCISNISRGKCFVAKQARATRSGDVIGKEDLDVFKSKSRQFDAQNTNSKKDIDASSANNEQDTDASIANSKHDFDASNSNSKHDSDASNANSKHNFDVTNAKSELYLETGCEHDITGGRDNPSFLDINDESTVPQHSSPSAVEQITIATHF
ncbi:monocarboxylate transporter 13-like [Lineus longissimus]|uniref:monocarboxylate transporter 13-like n=1 Tax=Lineus longissimus TaxID=88925 RepID=UPI002B4FA0C0